MRRYIANVLLLLLILVEGCDGKETLNVTQQERNHTQKELILYMEDDSYISRETYDALLEENGVLRGTYYTPMAYYDFEQGYATHDGEVRNASLLEPSELIAGHLPEEMNEVLFWGEDESMIDREFLLYISNNVDYDVSTIASHRHTVVLNVKVTGLQNVYPNRILFSDDFCMQLVQAMEIDRMPFLEINEYRYGDSGITHFTGDVYDLEQSGQATTTHITFTGAIYVDETLKGSEIMESADTLKTTGFWDHVSLGYNNSHIKEKVDKFLNTYQERIRVCEELLDNSEISYGEYLAEMGRIDEEQKRARMQDELGSYRAELTYDYFIYRDLTLVDYGSPEISNIWRVSREMYDELFPEQVCNRILLTVDNDCLDEIEKKASLMGLKTHPFRTLIK